MPLFWGGGGHPSGFIKLFDKDSIPNGVHELNFDFNGNYLGFKTFPFPKYNRLPNIQSITANENGRFITGMLGKDTVYVGTDTILNLGFENAISIGFDTNLNHTWTFSSSNYFDQFRDAKLMGDTLVASGHFDLFNSSTVTFDTINHTGNQNVFQAGGIFNFNATTGQLLGLYPSKSTGFGANVYIASSGISSKFMGIGGSFSFKTTFSGTTNYMEAVDHCSNCTNTDAFFAVIGRNGQFVAEDVIYTSGFGNNGTLAMHFYDSMLYIGGFLGDSVIIPNVSTFYTRGSNDAFIAAYKLDFTTSLAKPTYLKAKNGILAYPNPTTGNITLMGKAVSQQATLYNISGQAVRNFSLDINAFSQAINLNELKPGVYFLRIVGEGDLQQLKIVVK